MIEQTIVAPERCPLVGVAFPEVTELLSNKQPITKNPIFTEEPLGIERYDNALFHRIGLHVWQTDGKARGTEGEGLAKGKEEGDGVVVSADGWAGGFFCYI